MAADWLLVVLSGGSSLVSECLEHVRKHGELSSGKVFVSSAGSLPCKAVIHTVGPMWKDGSGNEDADLQASVRSALEEADRGGHCSVSVPAVSCGVYGFPVERGARITISELRQFLTGARSVTDVSVVSGRSVIEGFHETLMSTSFGPNSAKQVTVSQPDDGTDLGLCVHDV